MRQRGRRYQRGIRDANAVVKLILFLQAAQDGHSVLHAGFTDKDRLEAPRERRVLFHMLAVFIERSGPDAMQFAARQRGLQQVGSIHRAIRLAGPDDRVHFIDEENDPAGGSGHFLQHGFQPLLEFAAVFRPGDERAHVERQQFLVLQTVGHVTVDDAQREAFHDGGLADARLPDQHRVILGAAGKHLHRAADFLVAADHRVELALACGLGEIAGILLQRIISVFRRGAVGRAALAQRLDGRIERLRRDAGAGENFPRFTLLVHGNGEQQPLGGDKAVARLLRNLLSLVKNPRQRGLQINLPGARARHLWQLAQRHFGFPQSLA